MARQPLKPRSDDGYDNRTHGTSDSYVPMDDKTLKANLCPVTMIRPKLKDGPLCFRPWPALSYTNPGEDLAPGRKHADDHGQSHWICRVPLAMYIGCPDRTCEQVSFVAYSPMDREGRARNPYRQLYYAAKAAHKAGNFGPGRRWDADWNKLMEGEKGKGAPMSALTHKWYIQGIVFQNGDKLYGNGEGGDRRTLPLGMDENDDLVVIQISKSAGENLMHLLDTRKANIPDDADGEERPWELFKYGDATGKHNKGPAGDHGTVSGGLIISVFDPRTTAKQFKDNKNMSWDGDERALRKSQFTEHHAAVSRRLDVDGTVWAADLDKAQTARVFDKSQFWWDDPDSGEKGIIDVPSIHDQCIMIAKAFKTVPKLLEFAWADNDEYLNGEVMAILRQRRSSVVPGTDDERDEPPVASGRRPRTDPTQAGVGSGIVDDEDDSFPDDAVPPTSAAADGTEGDDEFDDEATTTTVAKTPTSTEVEDEFDGESPADAADELEAEAEAEAEVEAEAEAQSDDAFDDEPPAAVSKTAKGAKGAKAASDDFEEGDGIYANEEPAAAAAVPGKKAKAATTPAASQVSASEERIRASMEEAKNRAGKRASRTPPPTDNFDDGDDAEAEDAKPAAKSGKKAAAAK